MGTTPRLQRRNRDTHRTRHRDGWHRPRFGMCNFAAVAVAYSTEEADLYPGNRLKQDGYYFPKEIANCDDSGGEKATRLHAKWSERRTHFLHSLATHIVERCIENGVGRGLYVCEEHDDAFNADVNGAENIRFDINNTGSNSESSPSLGEDRSPGWLAQPGVSLHDLSRGFQPRTEVGDCKP